MAMPAVVVAARRLLPDPRATSVFARWPVACPPTPMTRPGAVNDRAALRVPMGGARVALVVLPVLEPMTMLVAGELTVSDDPAARWIWPLVELGPASVRPPAVTAAPALICRAPPATMN